MTPVARYRVVCNGMVPLHDEIFLVVHSDDYQLFSLDKKSSRGLNRLVTEGTPDVWLCELREAASKIYGAYRHQGLNSSDVISQSHPLEIQSKTAIFDINVKDDRFQVSCITRLVWGNAYLLGISKVPLTTGGSEPVWIDNLRVGMYPYKVGKSISHVMGPPLFSPEPIHPVALAYLDFVRLE